MANLGSKGSYASHLPYLQHAFGLGTLHVIIPKPYKIKGFLHARAIKPCKTQVAMLAHTFLSRKLPGRVEF